jgi:hypothetical protein
MMINIYSPFFPVVLEPVAKFARLRQKRLIFENRSGAYLGVCEQRITENQAFLPSIVEFIDRLLEIATNAYRPSIFTVFYFGCSYSQTI